ncbi:MAG: hypothetical protein KDL87_12710 [Verrucomicrobiae bacterium]|nr:hypothetical protein [Verrucomicrobiae bacterium]
MKTVEIFIDESGDIRRRKPMNITGLAVISPTVEARDAFHAAYLTSLAAANLTAGICDHFAPNDGRQPLEAAEAIRMPGRFIPKRPVNGDWQGFWQTIQQVADTAHRVAGELGINLVAFSLQFPATTERRWGTPDAAIDQLLDRPYSECLKDVLELLIFETPQIDSALRGTEGSLLSVDLPTRTFGAPVEDGSMPARLASAWGHWGLKARSETNRETGQPEIVAGTLDPADAIEILTTALNRRPAEPIGFQVERARCCKLISWSQWDQIEAVPDPKRQRNRRFWAMENSPRPKQIHFLVDFLSNGIFNEAIRPNMDPYRIWFDRGFLLSSATEGAAEWLGAVRAFANGDRVGALKAVHSIRSAPAHDESTKTAQFFRRCAVGWPDELKAADLQRLFSEIG